MPVAFDTAGMERHDERTWFDPRTGDQVSLTYIGMVPDIPAPLDDLPRLRRALAEETAETGAIIEAHVVRLGGLPALLQLIKLPIPGQDTGLAFIAAFTVPKATCSAVLRVQCTEGQMTGMRESTVAAQVGFENCFPPHPYAPGLHGQLPYNVADEATWDQQFPDHPLTRARAWAHRTLATAHIDPRFAALPAFEPAGTVNHAVVAPERTESLSTPEQAPPPPQAPQAPAPPTPQTPASQAPAPQASASQASASHASASQVPAPLAPEPAAPFDPNSAAALEPAAPFDPNWAAPEPPAPFDPNSAALDTAAPFDPNSAAPEPPAPFDPTSVAAPEPPAAAPVFEREPAPSLFEPQPEPAPSLFEPQREPARSLFEPVPEPVPEPVEREPTHAAPEAARSLFEPEPEEPAQAPAEAGDVLRTVLVGLPLGGYLPLWQEDGVTFWKMSDPDAVRARLGSGVESRSEIDKRRFREAAMFSPSRGTLFLMDRYRDESGHLGGTSTQLTRATEEEAYAAVDDKALSELYAWLGDVVLDSVGRGEFVAIESGGWQVPMTPVVLVMLRTDGKAWHSVVETSPVPEGAPVWRDQQPVEGNTQVLASPATDRTVRAAGLLTRFAVATWGMHPFQLGLSFGPNPTLQQR